MAVPASTTSVYAGSWQMTMPAIAATAIRYCTTLTDAFLLMLPKAEYITKNR